MFTHKKYPAKFKPYIISDVDFLRIMETDPFWEVAIDVLIIPILRQSWLTPECLQRVTSIQHYFDDAWALRVGYAGDEHAGHIGVAYAPFVCEHPVATVSDERNRYVLSTRDGRKIEVASGLVHPVKREDGYWYWRVELNRRFTIIN